MAIFGFGKDKKESGASSEQILAYLEEAQRNRTAFTLVGPKKNEAAATLQGIDESEGVVTFQSSLHVEKGAKIEFIFLQESLRVGGSATVVEVRPSTVQISLPETLELKERRSQPRARLNPKEGTTLTALTGLFEGVGINGVVENLSEGGARIRVDKALNLKGEKRLPLGSSLVPRGQPFMMIKLNKAPKCPAVMELTGRAVFLDTSAGGLTMGIAFDPMRPDLASALRNLVSSRTTAIPSVLPPKARRRIEPPPTAPEPRAPEPAPSPKPVQASAPAAQASAATDAPTPAPAPPSASAPTPAAAPGQASVPAEAPPASPRNDAITRLKMRSRAVVVLASSPAHGDMMKDQLQEEGFGRALVTSSTKEFLEFLQQPNLAVLFIDGDLSTLDALQFISQLKAVHPMLPPVILAVEEASTAVVLTARRNGVSQILVKPYALDAAFADLLSQQF
ncbi:MAG: response regulator [Holophaga sp.]|nr:response regulator [Holophaga sp.]